MCHKYSNEIICPWCGYKYHDSSDIVPDEEDIGFLECPNCEKSFEATRNIIITYSTSQSKYGTCKKCNSENVPLTNYHGLIGKYNDFCLDCRDKENVRLQREYMQELKNFKL